MTENKPELYELSALMQRQAEVIEEIADKAKQLPSLETGQVVGPQDFKDLVHNVDFHLFSIYGMIRDLSWAQKVMLSELSPDSPAMNINAGVDEMLDIVEGHLDLGLVDDPKKLASNEDLASE
ncbi:hypothetical protein [Cryobacterium sp. GrIS_2_6]|uniref:hypothetical protein n=1 Tax=Cryobacterium sp. GrIS_2_6 TaxID=3162785 RepID=UPI002DF8E2EB|nr:hypothetical protein [Cryobacterium psychrotolerans]